MSANPIIYEINTRVWLRRFDTASTRASLADVPETYWDSLAARGIECVWLMGVWGSSERSVKKYCFVPSLEEEYARALGDWEKADVIGSPYSIESYQVNPRIGSKEDLRQVREFLNARGMSLVLDFVPNHFSAESPFIRTHPDVFLSLPQGHTRAGSDTFFKPSGRSGRLFAHGKDPHFGAWQDTVQVNYFAPAARTFMLETLLDIAEHCDGVRCDMAMLVLNDVFELTWRDELAASGYSAPTGEFWFEAIDAVKQRYPDFFFIAEAYWNLEQRLEQLGFDFIYDKTLTDRLRQGHASDVREHLAVQAAMRPKLVSFLENHDEERAIKAFGKEKSYAAAVAIGTLPGMRLFYDGQFEGRSVRLPVQLGREPCEPLSHETIAFYETLLDVLKARVFRDGSWEIVNILPVGEGDDSWRNCLAWQRRFGSERRLIVINYSSRSAVSHVRIDVEEMSEEISFTDLLKKNVFLRRRQDIETWGLYVKLEAWGYHVFSIAPS